MKLSIVIPLFNQLNFTKSCLNDLSKLENVEIILIDNHSTDGTEDYLKNNKFNYIRLDKNYGFGHAVNIGISKAISNNIMILNNDIRVKQNHEKWVDEVLKFSKDGLVGPTVGYLDNKFNFIRESSKLEKSEYSYMSGWCLTASKEIWDRLKIRENEFFDERFFVYFEDTDLGFRAHKLGIKFIVVDIPVIHFGKQSSKQLNTKKLYLESKKIFEEKWEQY